MRYFPLNGDIPSAALTSPNRNPGRKSSGNEEGTRSLEWTTTVSTFFETKPIVEPQTILEQVRCFVLNGETIRINLAAAMIIMRVTDGSGKPAAPRLPATSACSGVSGGWVLISTCNRW